MPAGEMASEAAWESQKSTIQHLYLSEDKPLKAVIDVMAKSFGFLASKSKYERQFKKWQFRKNLKNHEWKVVDLHLSKRKTEGKESDLYVDGILVPKKKVQKEVSRNCFTALVKQCARAPSPEIPNSVSIFTPAASGVDTLQTDNLPWFRFETFLQSEATRAPETITASPFLAATYRTRMVATDSLQAMNWTTFVRRSTKLPEDVRLGIATWISSTPRESHITSVQAMNSKLLVTMPEMRVGEHMSSAMNLLRPITQDTTFHMMKLLNRVNRTTIPCGLTLLLDALGTYQQKLVLYLLSNNLLTPSLKLEDKIIQWLHLEENFCILEYLISIAGPTTEALAEALFQSAVKAEDIKIVKTLIDSGLSPDDQVIEYWYKFYTPLEYASFKGNLDLARILLDAGANVNPVSKTHDGATALQYAAGAGALELVKLLLAREARVNVSEQHGPSALYLATVRVGDIESVRLLLSAGADIESKGWKGSTALCGAVGHGNIDIVNTLLRAGADINTTTDENETLIERATVQGSLELVRVLLDAGARRFGDSLCLAATGIHDKSDVEMVKSLLNAGAFVDHRCYMGTTALTEAALNDDIELVRLLIAAGADIDGCAKEEFDENPMTPLQAASQHKTTDLAEILLDAGANVNARAPEENWYESWFENRYESFTGTALQIAAYNGNIELSGILLQAGATVNAPPARRGRTALQAAVYSNNITLIETLLDAGAHINALAAEERGRTALQTAIEVGDHYIINRLLEAGADVDGFAAQKYGITALTAAIRGREARLVYVLLNAGADVNNPSGKLWGGTALEATAANNDIELVRYLLSIGAEPNDSFALLVAVGNRNIELLQILLAADGHLNICGRKKYGSVALQASVSLGDLNCVRMLLAAGVDLNAPASSPYGRARECNPGGVSITYGEAALGTATRREDHQMVRFLLEAGADPNIVTRFDYFCAQDRHPPLWHAVDKGNDSITQILLEAGADVNAFGTREFGRNALQMAAQKGEIEIVRVLLKAGANADAPPADKGGVTALQAAAIGGYFGIACILIEANADVNAAPAMKDGRTALEGAAEHGRIDMLQLLLDAGAAIEGSGRAQYDRALEFAARHGHNAACRLLRAYHASRYGAL